MSLEEELGKGAFGKVYKGTIKQATTVSRRLSVMPPVSPLWKSATKQAMPFTVAVKMLHGKFWVIFRIISIACTTDETKLWLSPAAKQSQNLLSRPSPVFQDLSLLGAQNKDLGVPLQTFLTEVKLRLQRRLIFSCSL